MCHACRLIMYIMHASVFYIIKAICNKPTNDIAFGHSVDIFVGTTLDNVMLIVIQYYSL